MPRLKKRKNIQSRVSKKSKAKTARLEKKQSWMQSYSSLLLGIVVVIVAVLFVVTLIKQQSRIQQTSSISTGPATNTGNTAPSPTPGSVTTENGQTYYVVKPNDSLWTIAETVYKDGYSWTKIANANNLANPSTIFTGDKLLLPNAPQPSQLGQMLQPTSASANAITGNSYTVQKGDTLWDIALRAYADGYSWTKIANANNLTNPNLIFSGNVLVIPR